MNSFIQMNIFFFVTTIVVILLGILSTLILFKVFQILKYVEMITRDVSEESALLRRDIQEARLSIQMEGFKFKQLLSIFRGSLGRFVGKAPKKESKKDK